MRLLLNGDYKCHRLRAVFLFYRKDLVALLYESVELSYRIKMLRKDAHAETEGKIFLQESY